ncbi:hypothetical protein [Sphingomonas abaci]|uniref:Uncharacterized protein n=1 Tax=Sphingomonas abaci TaxID=237611 RepID=A0A7W7EYG9_9SPHN|nr:hypothetical protein [Sphingomonas abaci]MBB4618647.1 hypothetical protein [Sphingomonas abaci]
MTILKKLAALESQNRLLRYIPHMDPDEAAKRVFLMSAKHMRWLTSPEGTTKSRVYRSRVRAAIGEYVKGEAVLDNNQTLKKLQPPGLDVWVYKITFTPHARIIGFFVDYDKFIGLERKFRHELEGDAYDEARDRAVDRWNFLFKDSRPHSGHSLFHCISNVRLEQ